MDIHLQCSSSMSLRLVDILHIEDRLSKLKLPPGSSSPSIPKGIDSQVVATPDQREEMPSPSSPSVPLLPNRDNNPSTPSGAFHSKRSNPSSSIACLSSIRPSTLLHHSSFQDIPYANSIMEDSTLNLLSPGVVEFQTNSLSETPMVARQIRNSRVERKLSFISNTSTSSKDNANDSGTGFDQLSKAQIILHTSEEKHPLMLQLSKGIPKSYSTGRFKNLFKHHTQGHTLILTTKSNIYEWAEVFRPHHTISLLVYSESLAKRRRMGVHKLSSYDVVIATYDGEYELFLFE